MTCHVYSLSLLLCNSEQSAMSNQRCTLIDDGQIQSQRHSYIYILTTYELMLIINIHSYVIDVLVFLIYMYCTYHCILITIMALCIFYQTHNSISNMISNIILYSELKSTNAKLKLILCFNHPLWPYAYFIKHAKLST